MSFECPYYQNNYCVLQKGNCKPAIGKCILKGKVKLAKYTNEEEISGNNKIKIALFGASGRTGKLLAQMALNKGYSLNCLLRSPEKLNISNAQISIIKGNLDNYEAIKSTLQNCNVVVSVLGHVKNSAPMFQTNAIKKIAECMRQNDMKRIIILTGAGIALENEKLEAGNKLLTFIIKKIAPGRFADGVAQCNVLSQSGLNYTIVRVPLLTNKKIQKKPKAQLKQPGIFSNVSRLNVADFILNCVENEQYIEKAPYFY
jgi:hypothetical protein